MSGSLRSPKLRMYILVRFAVLAAAHASLAAHLRSADTPEVKEFARAKETPGHIALTESALDGQEVAIVFKPRAEYPKAFRFFRLYR